MIFAILLSNVGGIIFVNLGKEIIFQEKKVEENVFIFNFYANYWKIQLEGNLGQIRGFLGAGERQPTI